MRSVVRWVLAGAVAVGAAAACGGAPSVARSPSVASPPGAKSEPPPAVSCTRAGTKSIALPLAPAHARASSTVALAKSDDRTIAYVADEDTLSLRTIDVDAGREVASTPLDGKPSHVLVLPDGRVVVGLRDVSRLQVLEPTESPDAPLGARCAVDVAAEPVAFALTPDDATLLVSSGWGRALGAYSAKDLARQYEVALPREPRAVVVSDDGSSAYVAHAVGGWVSRVPLAAAERKVSSIPLHGPSREELQKQAQALSSDPRGMRRLQKHFQKQQFAAPASCQGFALAKTEQPAGRILAPQVLVDPGQPETRPSGYGADNDSTEAPDVAVLDAATGAPFETSIEKPQTAMLRALRGRFREDHHEECLLPRAAAYDAATKSVLVACLGIDAVVAYDALAASPARAEKRRWTIGAGPTGIAVDDTKHRALVWSQFDRVLTAIPLDGSEVADDKGERPAPLPRVALAADPKHPVPVALALGRLLFHAVGDGRISQDGRACASCHPDGRDDSLVWATPEGPRRSIMLAGRVSNTAPYSWSGTEKSLEDHLSITFDRLHGAGGLRSLELDALAAYVDGLAPPVVTHTMPDVRVDRGAQLFASKDVGCSGCHTGRDATDNQHHDVKSKTDLDRNALFNTPTLKFVGGTGPYFHDGRYATLRDLLRETDGKMGHTSQLSADDLDALEAYVRSL